MIPIRDDIPSRRTPVTTLIVIGANVVFFLMGLGLSPDQAQGIAYLFGIVPLRYTDPQWAQEIGFPVGTYWPFLTSLFLHGGLIHLVSNMWTLWIFGDNVEDRMGPARFIVFYLVCGVAAGVVHTIVNADSVIPAIGASGAIAGVLGAYMIQFPFARVLVLVPVIIYPLFLHVPAFLFMLLWAWLQFFSGTLSLFEPGDAAGVAWWAHIGGFGAGILLHGFFLRGDLPPPLPPEARRRVLPRDEPW